MNTIAEWLHEAAADKGTHGPTANIRQVSRGILLLLPVLYVSTAHPRLYPSYIQPQDTIQVRRLTEPPSTIPD